MLAREFLFLYFSLVLRYVSDLQTVWEYGRSSVVICSLVAGICSLVSFVQFSHDRF